MRRNKKKTRSQCLRRCYVHKSNPERCAQLGKNVPRDLSLSLSKKKTYAERKGSKTERTEDSELAASERVRIGVARASRCVSGPRLPADAKLFRSQHRTRHTHREREREREGTETRTEWQKRSRGPRCRCSSGRPKGHPTRSDLVMDAAVAPPPEPRAPTNGGPAPPPSPGATGWPRGNVTRR